MKKIQPGIGMYLNRYDKLRVRVTLRVWMHLHKTFFLLIRQLRKKTTLLAQATS